MTLLHNPKALAKLFEYIEVKQHVSENPDITDACWLTRPNLKINTSRPRTHFNFDKLSYQAHRIAYEIFVGPIPDSKQINHKCDISNCCNPSHLYAGTQQQNVTDRVQRGRCGDLNGTSNGMSKLTEDEVISIYKSHMRVADLAEAYETSQSNVYRIKNRELWQSLLNEKFPLNDSEAE